MTLKNAPHIQTSDLVPPKYVQLPRKKIKKEKHVMTKMSKISYLILFTISVILLFSIDSKKLFGYAAIFSVAVSAFIEFTVKVMKPHNLPEDMKHSANKIAITLQCASIGFLNLEFYVKYGASSELIYLFLFLPALVVYWTIWKFPRFSIFIDLYFPFVCMTMMYSCVVTFNTFGAFAAMSNAWAHYIKVNLKNTNDAQDIYNIVMCVYVCLAFEGLAHEQNPLDYV